MNKKVNGVISYLWIIVGALMASFSVACIQLPNDAIDYGTAGIAIIINKLTNINLSVCVTMVMAPFLIAAVIFMGKRFFAKAAVGAAVYTVGLAIFERIPFELNKNGTLPKLRCKIVLTPCFWLNFKNL